MRRYFYLLIGICFGFIVVGLLGLFFIGPTFFNRKQDVKPVDKKLIVASNESDDPAYIYWYAPSNTMGIKSYKSVNWSFFKQKFNQHSDWILEYKHYSYSEWTEGNQYLTVNKSWNDSGFWKISLIFDVPVDIYSARFTFGIDLSVLDYVERDGSEVWLNYSANQTENYSVFFNWSDLASIPNLVITKGKTDGMFWFRFRRDDIPSGVYEFDPIFGKETSGTGWSTIKNNVQGSSFICPENCQAESITARLDVYQGGGAGEGDIVFGIFLNSTDVKIAQTENITDWSGSQTWLTLWFTNGSEPVLTGDVIYYIGAWCNGDPEGASINRVSGGILRYKELDFDGLGGVFPNDLTPLINENRNCSIYVTYTAVGGLSWQGISWSMNGTLFNLTSFKPVDYSINGSLFNQTSLKPINWSINGTIYNLTIFKPVNWTVNGTIYNNTLLQGISWSMNGTVYNMSVVGWKNIQMLNGTVFNLTISQGINWSINGTLWNDTITWNPIDYNINGTLWNQTIVYINITNPFPPDGSFNAPLQPFLYININSTIGDIMNISWYYGLSVGNENIFLGNDLNISNSTQSMLFFQASNRMTPYFWRVMADDGIHYINETFGFTTEGYSGVIGNVERINYGVIGILFGIFGLIGFVFIFVYRKKNS